MRLALKHNATQLERSNRGSPAKIGRRALLKRKCPGNFGGLAAKFARGICFQFQQLRTGAAANRRVVEADVADAAALAAGAEAVAAGLNHGLAGLVA